MELRRRALASDVHLRARVRAACAIVGVLVAACSTAPATEPDSPDADVSIDALDVSPDAPSVTGELRGVWVTRFAYSTRAQLEAIIDRAAAAHFNAVFFQIRGEGDAYYHSTHEPWARRLTGTLGRDPGWDPLQVAIDRAHAHGLELHAYFNVFSAWPASLALPQAEGPVQHALSTHPDWLAVDSTGTNRDTEYRWFSPGNPAVRAHIVATATELLATYAVDGLHLDRIRTSGADYSRDAVTVAAYNAARTANPALTWGEFMRAQVDAMVAELHAALLATRPSARYSAAVWGIYEPLPGCATSQGRRDYHQDSLGWLQHGTIDAIVPMIYWDVEPGSCTDFAALAGGFIAGRAGRHVWTGMHALDAGAWNLPALEARVARSRDGAQGLVVFASAYLDEEPARWTSFVGTAAAPGVFFEPAPTPAMAWK